MKVKCIAKIGKSLPNRYLKVASKQTEYSLIIGKVYTVYAITSAEDIVEILLIDEWGDPSLFPCPLFEIVDNNVPLDWKFAFWGEDLDDSINVTTVFGYKEFAEDKKHFRDLILHEHNALRVFFRRKEICYEELNEEEIDFDKLDLKDSKAFRILCKKKQ